MQEKKSKNILVNNKRLAGSLGKL